MSKDGLTQVEYALMLGRLGYRVIPLCWPSNPIEEGVVMAVEPFKIQVPDSVLDDLKSRL